jgi:hypothetical protein
MACLPPGGKVISDDNGLGHLAHLDYSRGWPDANDVREAVARQRPESLARLRDRFAKEPAPKVEAPAPTFPYKAFDLLKPPSSTTLENPSETTLVPPPSPQQEAAAAAGEEARAQIEQWADDFQAGHKGRQPWCGKMRKAFRKKDNPRRGFFAQLRCGRLDCPECRGRQVGGFLKRCARRVLHAEPGEVRYREQVVYLLRTFWDCWATFNKCLWRQHVKRLEGDRRERPGLGWLRVRTAGNEVLIVSECPLPGAEAVTPADAALRVAECIRGELWPGKHAVHLLGRWRTRKKEAEWEPVETNARPEAVQALVREFGGQVKPIPAAGRLDKGSFGFGFNRDLPEAAVEDFWLRLTLTAEVVAKPLSEYCPPEDLAPERETQTTAPPPAPDGAVLHFQDANGRRCGADKCHRWTWTGASRWYLAGEHPPPNGAGA